LETPQLWKSILGPLNFNNLNTKGGEEKWLDCLPLVITPALTALKYVVDRRQRCNEDDDEGGDGKSGIS